MKELNERSSFLFFLSITHRVFSNSYSRMNETIFHRNRITLIVVKTSHPPLDPIATCFQSNWPTQPSSSIRISHILRRIVSFLSHLFPLALSIYIYKYIYTRISKWYLLSPFSLTYPLSFLKIAVKTLREKRKLN